MERRRAGAASGRGGQRDALRNGILVRYTLTVLLNLIAEWAIFLGILVYIVDRSGPRSVGLYAVAMLVPYVAMSPLAGALAARCAAQRVRIGAMTVQTVAWTITAIAAHAQLESPIVVGLAMIGIAASPTLGPAGAVLRPAIVRSSNQLIVANLWVGYVRSLSVLGGPLITTGMLLIGGSPAVVAACAASSSLALALSIVGRSTDTTVRAQRPIRARAGSLMRHQLSEVRRQPGIFGVVAVAGGQFFAIGALDVVIVVAAEHELDIGPSGPGLLASAFGLGAFVSAAAATALVHRPRLAPVLVVAMLAAAASTLLLGATLSVAAAFILLPVLGVARSLTDLLGRLLLQRSADPQALGAVFAVLELAAGIGLILGSLVAQLLIVVAGVHAAFAGIGSFFLALLAVTYRSLRVVDDSANLPVVAMSLLRRIPVFTPLPGGTLERVARDAVEVAVGPGAKVIVSGERGDRFFAVADGRFDVVVAGEVVRTVERGGSFGELALLADIPRTASVIARSAGVLLAIERRPFLGAVNDHDASRQAAWRVMRDLHGGATPVAGPHEFATS